MSRVPRHRRSSRATLLGLGVLLLTLCASGTAFAYWTATGSGHGSATAGTPIPLTVTTNGTPGTRLQPGASGDLVLTVANPNPFSVQLTAVAGNGAVTAAGGGGSCINTGVTVSVPAGDLPLTIPANATGTRVVLANAVSMGAGSDSGCQGASFTIPVAVAAVR